MAVNKVTYGGKTLVDLTSDSVTPDKLASGVTAHDKSGNKITGTMSANFKAYEITLAKASGWILLTTLDAEVLEHINDESLVVTLVNMSPYKYEWYAGGTFIVTNIPMGYSGTTASYGIGNREQSATSSAIANIFHPANNTADGSTSGFAIFRVNGGKYYIKPGDGFLKAGTYRLTFMW